MERDKIVANSVVTATYGLNLVIASVEQSGCNQPEELHSDNTTDTRVLCVTRYLWIWVFGCI